MIWPDRAGPARDGLTFRIRDPSRPLCRGPQPNPLTDKGISCH